MQGSGGGLIGSGDLTKEKLGRAGPLDAMPPPTENPAGYHFHPISVRPRKALAGGAIQEKLVKRETLADVLFGQW